jgi:hypothetical protein
MSHGLIVVPRSLRMFQRERRSNKPASAGGFRQHLENRCAPRVPDSATINYSFRPRVDPPDYPIGRFGDGTYAVFYSALEDATCVEEVRHHRRAELLALQSGQIPFARFFTLVKCDFNGRSLMLRGHERAHADLTSPTAAGYPFCQAVARWARRIGAQALHTASARQANGTCVPVFVRACLANPQTVHRYRFYSRNGVVECEGLPPHA